MSIPPTAGLPTPAPDPQEPHLTDDGPDTMPLRPRDSPPAQGRAFNDDITTPMLQSRRLPLPSRGWRSRFGDGGGGGGMDSNERESLLPLLLGAGVVVALVLVLAIVVFASLSPGLRTAVGSHPPVSSPARSQPTATPTPTPAPTPTTPSPPATAAAFVASDNTTQGDWPGVYGGEGALVVADGQHLPDATQVALSGTADYTWVHSTADRRALRKQSDPAARIAACWYASGSFAIDVRFTDGQAHQLALYLVDWDRLHRMETISLLDAATRAPLDVHIVADFTEGQYLVWRVQGALTIQVTNEPGSINAVVSGLFFAPA